MYDEGTSLHEALRLSSRAMLRNKITCSRSTTAALALGYRLDALLQDADGNVSFSGIFASHPSAVTAVTSVT